MRSFFSNRIIKAFLSLIITLLFLYISYLYLLSDKHKNLLNTTSLYDLLISAFFLFTTFLLAGLELKYAYKMASNLTITKYDTISLPYVMNIWGYIIPIQGSFIYTMTYLKFRYKIDIRMSTSVYIYLFLISLSVAGFIGIIFLINSAYFSFLLFLVLFILLLNPFLLILLRILLLRINFQVPILIRLHSFTETVISNINLLYKNISLTILIISINIATTFVNAIWSFWICSLYGFNTPFIVLLLVSFLLKLTALFKITPGNLGLIQLASGGIFILFGFSASIGVFISLFQFITLVVFSFPAGLIFTFINLRYFSKDNIILLFKGANFHNYNNSV